MALVFIYHWCVCCLSFTYLYLLTHVCLSAPLLRSLSVFSEKTPNFCHASLDTDRSLTDDSFHEARFLYNGGKPMHTSVVWLWGIKSVKWRGNLIFLVFKGSHSHPIVKGFSFILSIIALAFWNVIPPHTIFLTTEVRKWLFSSLYFYPNGMLPLSMEWMPQEGV